MLNTFVVYVENKPGVLNRVASLFRRRAFNIESLTVGHTDKPGVSRMTIVVDTDEQGAKRAEANLYKLVNVLLVNNVTAGPTVMRDLAMVKVAANPETRSHLLQLVHVFRARVVDVAPESVIVEITGTEEKIDGLLEVLRPFGIVEMVRTGRDMATRPVRTISRMPIGAQHLDQAVDLVLVAGDFDDERLVGHVDDAGAEDMRQLHDLRRVSGVAATLIMARSRMTDGVAGHVFDAAARSPACTGWPRAAARRLRRYRRRWSCARRPASRCGPTVSDSMLKARRRNSDATRFSTPGLFSTSTTKCHAACVFLTSSLRRFDQIGLGRRIMSCRSAPAGTIGIDRVFLLHAEVDHAPCRGARAPRGSSEPPRRAAARRRRGRPKASASLTKSGLSSGVAA